MENPKKVVFIYYASLLFPKTHKIIINQQRLKR